MCAQNNLAIRQLYGGSSTASTLVRLGKLLAPKFKFDNRRKSTELLVEAVVSGGGPRLCT